MLKYQKLFNQVTANNYADRVLKLNSYFQNYGEMKYSILGTASYANQIEEYKKLKLKNNPIIRDNFKDLLDELKYFLESILNKNVKYDENLSYPGFHIFYGNHRDSIAPLTSLHIDTPYKIHERYFLEKYKNVDFDYPLTFTLILKIPEDGAGLYYWDLDDWQNKREDDAHELYRNIYEKYAEIFTKYIPTREEYEILLKPKVLKYNDGYINVFKGNLLHQIIPFYSKNGIRVTLQGHGIFCDNEWILYF